MLALTFDDGPSEATEEIAGLVEHYGGRCTFFVCGQNAERRKEILLRLVAAGHELGNHTYSHMCMYFSRVGEIESELRKCEEVLELLSPGRHSLFRPPFGSRWFGLPEIEQGLGLRRVLWDVDSGDWHLDRVGIAKAVLTRVTPGSIVLFHDGNGTRQPVNRQETVAALTVILPELVSQGYRLVTVSELLSLEKVRDM